MTSNMQLRHCYSLQTGTHWWVGCFSPNNAASETVYRFYHNDSRLIFCKLVNPLPSDLHSAEGELFKQSGIRGSHYHVRLKTWIV